MTDGLTALAVGLGSALSLAAANTLVKAGGDILVTRGVMALSAALLVLPGAFMVPLPGPETIALLCLSLPAHWLYQTALIRSLSKGDLSLVFPIMRGSAPLLTAVGAALFLDERLPAPALAGLAVASASVAFFVAPRQAPSPGDRSAVLWAVATGACIGLYNVIDAAGVRSAESPWTFIVWLFLLDWIGVTAAAVMTRGGTYLRAMTGVLKAGFAAGLFSLVSFSLALYGFSITDVAYISATRETAVVFAAIMGWLVLKEGFGLKRSLSALCLCVGLALMQIGQMS